MDYFYVFQEYGMKQKILCHVFKDTARNRLSNCFEYEAQQYCIMTH